MPIADAIRAYRRSLGLTQVEAARRWGIQLKTLAAVEQGRKEPHWAGLLMELLA